MHWKSISVGFENERISLKYNGGQHQMLLNFLFNFILQQMPLSFASCALVNRSSETSNEFIPNYHHKCILRKSSKNVQLEPI